MEALFSFDHLNSNLESKNFDCLNMYIGNAWNNSDFE